MVHRAVGDGTVRISKGLCSGGGNFLDLQGVFEQKKFSLVWGFILAVSAFGVAACSHKPCSAKNSFPEQLEFRILFC